MDVGVDLLHSLLTSAASTAAGRWEPAEWARIWPSAALDGILGVPSTTSPTDPATALAPRAPRFPALHAGSRREAPWLLICHDYRGGYHGDALLFGRHVESDRAGGSSPASSSASSSASSASAAISSPELADRILAQFSYRLTHWERVQVFCYFSHNAVSPPPAGWVRAAHVHGALALGTVLTEWDEGARQCEHVLLRNPIPLARRLADMAQQGGFDGWLVNIENKVSDVQALCLFLRELTTATHQLLGPDSLIVWYDAVTRNGTLKHQSTVNDENQVSFYTYHYHHHHSLIIVLC